MKASFLFLSFLLFLTCRKPEETIVNENGVAIRLPHLWKTPISDGRLNIGMQTNDRVLSSQKETFLAAILDNKANNLPRTIGAINAKDGSILWRWSDWMTYKETVGNPNPLYTHTGSILHHTGLRTYVLDEKTGQTLWRKEWGAGFNRNGYTRSFSNDLLCFAGTAGNVFTNNRKVQESLFICSLKDGSIKDTIAINYRGSENFEDPSGFTLIGDISRIQFVSVESRLHLLVTYGIYLKERDLFGNLYRGKIGLYNVENRKWVYQSDLYDSSNAVNGANELFVEGDKLFIASNLAAICVDLLTGDRIWARRLTQASLLSDLSVVNNKVLVNGQDAKLYCLDAQTGIVLWTQKSSSIGSTLHVQDGVVYYIASKNLLAVDIATGKLLWDLPCPDAYTEGRNDSWFFGFVTGIPDENGQKGRIIATTHLNAYCFEAVK